MQVSPCRCIDFHAQRRSRPQNGPATIELGTNVAKDPLTTILVEPRATRLSEAAPPQSRTHVSRVIAPTHQYLTQTRAPVSFTRLDTSRGPRREAAPLGLARVARPRPRARRRLAPRDTMDHSRRTRLVPAAPAAVASQPHQAAPRRRGRELPKASSAFTATTGRPRGCVSTA